MNELVTFCVGFCLSGNKYWALRNLLPQIGPAHAMMEWWKEEEGEQERKRLDKGVKASRQGEIKRSFWS